MASRMAWLAGSPAKRIAPEKQFGASLYLEGEFVRFLPRTLGGASRGPAEKSRRAERGHLRFLMRTGDGIVLNIRWRRRLRARGPHYLGLTRPRRCGSSASDAPAPTSAPKGFGRRGNICFVEGLRTASVPAPSSSLSAPPPAQDAHARHIARYAFARERLASRPTALQTQPTRLFGRTSSREEHAAHEQLGGRLLG